MKLADASIEAALRKEITGPLSRAELLDIHREAVRRHRRGRRFRAALILMLAIGPAVMLFGPSMGGGPWAMLRWPYWGILVISVIALSIMLGLYRVLLPAYTGHLRAVARERGHEVCVKCGYWLAALDDEVAYCPECGARRLAMSTDSREPTAES